MQLNYPLLSFDEVWKTSFFGWLGPKTVKLNQTVSLEETQSKAVTRQMEKNIGAKPKWMWWIQMKSIRLQKIIFFRCCLSDCIVIILRVQGIFVWDYKVWCVQSFTTPLALCCTCSGLQLRKCKFFRRRDEREETFCREADEQGDMQGSKREPRSVACHLELNRR